MCQSLDPELEAELGRIRDTAPKYGVWTKIKVFIFSDRQIWPQLDC